MTSDTKENGVHLVLCGGGVRVISTIAAIQVMEEKGVRIQSISGISAGSLLGALLCSGITAKDLCEWIIENNLLDYAGKRKFFFSNAFPFLSALSWPFAQYDEPGFPQLYRKLVGQDLRFSELEIPFMTASLDIVSHRYEQYSQAKCPDMKVADALRISTAVPGWYPPVERDGKILIDAGLATRNPVWLTAEIDDQSPILILNPLSPASEKPKDFKIFLETLFAATMESHDHYILSQVIHRVPRIHSIDIDTGDISWHSFEVPRKDKEFLLNQGRSAMLQKLDELDGDFYRFDYSAMVPKEETKETRQPSAENAIAKLLQEIPANTFGTHKAFVSSTYQDLREHRAHVIKTLRQAGVYVDPMELWTADNDEPKRLSVERIEDCQLFVLLVGLRRGFIPPGETLSITQMEYEAARTIKGLDILVFLLDEDAPWPHRYDELIMDPQVKTWRKKLTCIHTVSFFGLDPTSIDIASSISRWLSNKLKLVHEITKEQ